MNIKKYWMVLAIAIIGLSTISCGGDDNDNEFSTDNKETSTDNKETGTNTESTAYLATEQVKTITLKPISEAEFNSDAVSSGEYLVYKDYYYKYTLCLKGTYLYINSYTNGGSGWVHYYSSNYVGTWTNISGIYDVGDVTDITKIAKRELYYDDCLRSYGPYGNSYGSQKYDRGTTFKPGHGYGIGFFTEADKEIKQMRAFPTKYTLNSNDVLTSVTIEYQLF